MAAAQDAGENNTGATPSGSRVIPTLFAWPARWPNFRCGHHRAFGSLGKLRYRQSDFISLHRLLRNLISVESTLLAFAINRQAVPR